MFKKEIPLFPLSDFGGQGRRRTQKEDQPKQSREFQQNDTRLHTPPHAWEAIVSPREENGGNSGKGKNGSDLLAHTTSSEWSGFSVGHTPSF